MKNFPSLIMRLLTVSAVIFTMVNTVNIASAESGLTQINQTTFDPDAPFVVLEGVEYSEPHIDSLNGYGVTDADVQSVADAMSIVELPDGIEGFNNAQTFSRRSLGIDNPLDVDVRFYATGGMDDNVILSLFQIFTDYREVINLELDDPYIHSVEINRVSNLPNGVLASTQTAYVYVNQGNSSYRIPLILADTLAGINHAPNAKAIRISFNTNVDWDYTVNPTDTSTNDYYMHTILAHEIGHGLGIGSGITSITQVPGLAPMSWGMNLYFDKDLTKSFNDYRTDGLQENNLWFYNTDGTWEKAYDPQTWRPGSSLSHLDEGSYPWAAPFGAYAGEDTPGTLMTPYLGSGQLPDIDGVMVGMLNQVGYNVFMEPSAPTISATYDGSSQTVNVSIEPTESGDDYVPAENWIIEILDDEIVLSTRTILATSRFVAIQLSLTEETYELRVTSETDNNTNSVNLMFLTDPPEVTTTTAPSTTVPEVTTTTAPSTTVPSTTVPEVTTTTAPSTTVLSTTVLEVTTTTQAPNIATTVPVIAPPVHYANCAAVRAAGLAPMLSTHESYRSVFDTDGNGIGCETTLIVSPDEPQLDAAAPATWYRFQIARLYSAYFGRFPDSGGWVYWNGRLSDGESLAEFSQFFSESPEFQATYGTGMSNSEFVSLVYVNVLQRDEDPEGYNYWVSQLDSGMTRGRLMIGFSESIEFQFNAGPQVTGSCWTGATSPHQTEAVNASYACYAAETPARN